MSTNPDRWARATRIFHAAILLPESQRHRFIAEECANDAELLAEVESLVDAHRPGTVVGRSGLAPGTRVGVYEITAFIDAGGMGEVYRAKDTRLKRDVALKILPSSFADDAERRARFQREAEVLASLNHPCIAQIFGFEESGEMRALAMEFVEGETLADRIARGRLPLDEALSIAKQVAEALEAAHEQGIVHRDLKPANIKLRPDGTVKVLDFGLAKLVEARGANEAGMAGGDLSLSPTITSPAMMTGVGVLLGTAAYMAPEQAKGRAADRRSDVWAFGCVVFEMLTGKRAFDGEDVSDTLAAVLRGEPDWNALPADTPASIRRLLRRCLEKDRKRRIDSAAVARLEIEDVLAGPVDATTPPGSTAIAVEPLWRRVIPVVVAAMLGGVFIGAVVWSLRPSAPSSPAVTRFPFILGERQQFSNQNRQSVAISPDGTQMVYVANQRLYLRSMSQIEARPMAGTDGAIHPIFSPDSRFIVFWSSADLTLKKISIDSGTAVTLCPADNPFGMSWDADGIVFGQRGTGIMRVSANGGKPEVLVRVKEGELVYGPQVLPGGQAVLFTLANAVDADLAWDKAHIVVQLLKSGERKTLVDSGADARYVPTGHLVYAVGGTLFAVPFDVRRFEVTGGPTPIVEGVRTNTVVGVAQFSFSNNGSLIYIPGPPSTGPAATLVVIDRKGVVEPLKLPPGPYEFPRISPDGTRVAFESDDGKDANVWIYELSGASAARRLTFGGRNRFPIWSSDGERVAFQTDREGDLGIFWQRADGTGTAERLTKPAPGIAHIPDAWSPDGNRFLFSVVKGTSVSLWTWSLPDKTATPFGDVQSSLPTNAVFSPDGRWVAYQAGEVFNNAVYAQPYPATGVKYQISKGLAHEPMWSPDGKELFYNLAREGLVVVRVTTQPSFTFGNPVTLPTPWASGGPTSVRRVDITPDGKLVKAVRADQTVGTPGPPQIQVVLSWFEELKRLVPTK